MSPSLAGTFAATAMEAALRTVLGADPATREEVKALAPARLDIELERSSLRITLVFTATGIRVEADAETAADASVRVTPAGLMDLLAGDRERALLGGGVTAQGSDVLIANVFTLLGRFQPDLERPLRRLFGDAPAAAVGAAARGGSAAARRAAAAGADITRDWLTSPDGPLPNRVEVARFLDEVDDARLATDRIAARVRLLAQALDARTEDPGAEDPQAGDPQDEASATEHPETGPSGPPGASPR